MISKAMEDVVVAVAKAQRDGCIVLTLGVPVHTRRALRRSCLVEDRTLRDGRTYFTLTKAGETLAAALLAVWGPAT